MSEIVPLEKIDNYIEKVRTRTLDLSFNELLDMYTDGELVIEPEYQRLFRWSEGQQSRFVESLILEMPVPPIFVIEIDDGIYELIDGLQRLSSYLHFRGAHKQLTDDEGNPKSLKLDECDIVSDLNGLNYEDLPTPIKIRLKRSFVRVEVIRKESDQRLRYYMFKRLNTGGAQLSQQEIRNCTIRLLDPDFNDFIVRLSQNEDFMSCINPVSEDKINQKYDQELVLRFFAFKNNRENYVHDVGEFMTDYMESVSDPSSDIEFDYQEEESIFNKTFKLLNVSLGQNAFSGYTKDNKPQGKFLSYHYEAFALGVQPKIDDLPIHDPQFQKEFGNFLDDIKKDDAFKELTTGGGKNYKKPLEDRISFVENVINNHYGH